MVTVSSLNLKVRETGRLLLKYITVYISESMKFFWDVESLQVSIHLHFIPLNFRQARPCAC